MVDALAGIFDQGLERTSANHVPLSPISFVERTAAVFGDLEAVVHGARRYDWAQVRERTARLASGLLSLGVGRGQAVSVLLSNTPEMIEAHYAIPAINAVLNTLNTRLDAAMLAWQIAHCESRLLITDTEFHDKAADIVRLLDAEHGRTITVINVADSEYGGPGGQIGAIEYEAFLAQHPPLARLDPPADEWDAIAISYTSGTTGDPKGVVTHYRGAYLNSLSNAVGWSMSRSPRFLWTLPMFHCNGWCFPWTIALLAGTHICLRQVTPAAIFAAFETHGADHYGAAPIVHNMLAAAPDRPRFTRPIRGMIGGAPPSAKLLVDMAAMGIDLTHGYGLTEVYGPAAFAEKRDSWADCTSEEQARLNGRQGVRSVVQEDMAVLDPHTMQPVPKDGESVGEIMFRGNVVMKGYLKNTRATREALADGWFHSGDLATIDADGYARIMDRSKDVIISGGENISSVEIEDWLYRHPAVLSCAVVGIPDPKWGEVPIAIVETKAGATVTAQALVDHCYAGLARFKVPKSVHFRDIPRTSTGKVQKFLLRDWATGLS